MEARVGGKERKEGREGCGDRRRRVKERQLNKTRKENRVEIHEDSCTDDGIIVEKKDLYLE